MAGLYRVAIMACLLGVTGAVIELNDNNFHAYALTKDVLLVDFYAPWCSDCKHLDPSYESASALLGTRSGDLAKVDCFGAGKGLCEMYGVKSWPQLKNFNRGTYTGDYTGLQTAEAMAGYINTVEDAASRYEPVGGNPYAMAFPQQQAGIKELTNADTPVEPAPPVVGPASCARCTIAKNCSKYVKKACVELKLREQAKEAEKHYDDDDKKRTYKVDKKQKPKKQSKLALKKNKKNKS